MKSTVKNLFIVLVIFLSYNAFSQNDSDAFSELSKSFTNLTQFKFFYKETDYTRAKEVMQDNEFERKGCSVQINPLQINGQTLDYATFDLNSRGVLSLVNGQANSQNIPFYVFIRRNGEVIADKKMTFLNKELYKVNLSDIFPFCMHGDMLIIKPAKSEDWMAKRILKLLGGC